MNACRLFGSIVLLGLPAVSLAQTPAPAAPAPHTAPAAKPVPTLPTTHGVVVADIDPAVKPGDNFYLYANGKWQANTEIPADRTGVSSFSVLADVVNARVQSIIADVYRSYTDQATIESRGLAPIKPQLAAIGAIVTTSDLSRALGLTLRADV